MRSIANHTACAAASRSAFYRQNALVLNADARWRTAALRNVIDSYTVDDFPKKIIQSYLFFKFKDIKKYLLC